MTKPDQTDARVGLSDLNATVLRFSYVAGLFFRTLATPAHYQSRPRQPVFDIFCLDNSAVPLNVTPAFRELPGFYGQVDHGSSSPTRGFSPSCYYRPCKAVRELGKSSGERAEKADRGSALHPKSRLTWHRSVGLA